MRMSGGHETGGSNPLTLTTMIESILRSIKFSSIVYDQEDSIIFDVQACLKTADFRNPEGRQRWNDQQLRLSGKRYLIGRYLEDRSALISDTDIVKKEDRAIHMGIDIFSKDLEDIHSPWPGKIIYRGVEPAPDGFGHHVVVEHELLGGKKWYSLFAHLGESQRTGAVLDKGEILGRLGDHDENGGWSRHLHYQLFKEEPEKIFGYVNLGNVTAAKYQCPNPDLVLKLPCLYSIDRYK